MAWLPFIELLVLSFIGPQGASQLFGDPTFKGAML